MSTMPDHTYARLLGRVLTHGEERGDRTGTGTLAMFGAQMRFDLSDGFPLLTTKRVFFKGIVEELLWFLRGETNVRSLQEAGVRIWDEWADENGELGPVYGAQWRSWPVGACPCCGGKGQQCDICDGECGNCDGDGRVLYDQIHNVINEIRTNPNCRRLIVTAWNPAQIEDMALPPCHLLFQFDVTADGRLNCQLYQRSADMFLGVPFNIASYALLTHMIAQVTGLKPGTFVWTGGNVHIYKNHVDQVNEQLMRAPFPAPRLELNPDITDIDGFTSEDIRLVGYKSHPAIKAEVSV